jgi:hypothetical protein
MWNAKSLTLVLLALGACAGGELQAAAAKADPLEELSLAALEKRVALNALRKEANPDRAQWPKGDVPGLDFTKATGNAIVVHHESGRHSNPFATLTTSGAPFKLFHIEDDPYRLALSARGIGLPKPEDKAKFRTDRYKPALEHIARAKYALFVVGKVEEPRVDIAVKSFTSGRLEAVAVLYEIESKKLLGGFTIEARNSARITTRTGGYTGQELAAVMHDFENNARAALWKGLKARFPSAKIPTIVYLDSKE